MESLCSNCNQPYNQFHKKMVMIPCGDAICLACFDVMLQPQESKLQCKLCGETSTINSRFKDKIQEMKESCQTLGIFCDKHPSLLAERFCQQHQAFVCHSCAIDYHGDHLTSVERATRKQTDQFCDNALAQLMKLSDKLNTLRQNLTAYKSSDKNFLAEEFKAIVFETQQILISPFLKTDKEMKEIQFLADTLIINKQQAEAKQANKKSKQTTRKEDIDIELQMQPYKRLKTDHLSDAAIQVFDFDHYSRDMFNIGLDEQDLLKQWIGKECKFELLYRGSRDGFHALKYFSKCENIAPTLTIIKSEHNQVFGGFMSVKLQNSLNHKQQADKEAFVFSLTKKTKHPQFKSQNIAVQQSKNVLIAFGSFDIYICNFCNVIDHSFSQLGGTYLPIGFEHNSNKCKSYLAGSEYFKVIEIETYQCTYL